MAIKQSLVGSPGATNATKAQNGNAADDKLPTEKELAKAGEVEIFDADSKALKLSSFFQARDGVPQRYLVVFIRHFFCGICQEYIRRLSSAIPPSCLPPNTHIIIIGCGQPSHLNRYISETEAAYPIYADPSKKLHQIFRMIRTLAPGPQTPEYLSHTSMGKITLRSIWQELKSGRQMLSGGDYSQVGGEFLFEVNADGEVKPTWCHRMQHTRDHAEISEIKKILGMESAIEEAGDSASAAPVGTQPESNAQKSSEEAQPPAANPERKKRWSSITGSSGGLGRRLSKRNKTQSWQVGNRESKVNGTSTGTNGSANSTSATTSNAAASKGANEEREILSRLKEEPEHTAGEKGQNSSDALTKLSGGSASPTAVAGKGAITTTEEPVTVDNGSADLQAPEAANATTGSSALLNGVAAVKEERKSQLMPDITAYQKEGSVEPA